MSNTFFDLHFHPVFKNMLCRWEDTCDTSLTSSQLSSNLVLSSDLLKIIDREFLHILGSQSSITQLKSSQNLTGIANIASLEFGFAASGNFFGKLLRSKITRPLDTLYFSKVSNGEVSYYHLFLHELELYTALSADQANGVQLLSRNNTATTGQDGVFLVLSMEGAHSLCRDLIGKKGWPELIRQETDTSKSKIQKAWNDFKEPVTGTPQDIPARNLERLYTALSAAGHDLLYITLTHLTHIDQQLLANHAYGMKILEHPAFFPQGFGLEEAGKSVIRKAYELKNGAGKETPILIDIKHMSLKSRLDFYDYRKTLNNPPPIVATHMGVTGYSWKEWLAAIRQNAVVKKDGILLREVVMEPMKAGRHGSFLVKDDYPLNPWSINMMDEDIIEVLKSSGLIGMSIDVRILGFQSRLGKLLSKEAAEYLSTQEANFFIGKPVNEALPAEIEMPEDEALIPGKNEHHPMYLAFNIMHILAVGKQIGFQDTWKHITIGSDFDGLINPIKLCGDCTERPALEIALTKWLPVAEKAYDEEHSSGVLLTDSTNPRKNIAEECDPVTLKRIVRAIGNDNGIAFLTKLGFIKE